MVEAATGLNGLAGRLAEGHGHLLDASGADWLEGTSEAQLGETRSALIGSALATTTGCALPTSSLTVSSKKILRSLPPSSAGITR